MSMSLLTAVGVFSLKALFVLAVLYVQAKVLTACLKNRCIAGSRLMEKLMLEEVYPSLDLPGQAREIQLKNPLCSWREERKLKKAGRPAAPFQGKLPPEEEKLFGYYARTGQFVCDVDRGVPLERWYQPEDWVRDIVAGEASDGILCQQVKPDKAAGSQSAAGTAGADKPAQPKTAG